MSMYLHICRTASSGSRNILFSSAIISKITTVDRRPISSNADYQEDALCVILCRLNELSTIQD